MTIGASNVHAFVGMDGPYWVDDDGDNEIDRDINGDIVADEVNDDAIGLVLDDFDFGMSIMKPTNPLDFTKFVALHATASDISLVRDRRRDPHRDRGHR